MTDDLLGILDLEPLEINHYRGRSVDPGWRRVFGGQVIGQALIAASRTVDPARLVHSLHGYFLRPGNPDGAIDYAVERIRDGGSFSTRRVVASQGSEAIFAMAASFHIEEPGFAHQAPMPVVPAPEALPDESALLAALASRAPASALTFWRKPRAIEIRPVDLEAFLGRSGAEQSQASWIRARMALPDDPAVVRAVLAYASDLTLLDTTLIAEGRWVFDPGLMVTSLDHAMWFHRPVRFDDWLLYVCDSPSASGARGFNRGALYDRAGCLVASVAQEGLVRQARDHQP
ncbi:acyl-CoA thioesterase-2 [Kaistia soli DSM 19436]|uniref:Acyl-CoA thioesterase 2 n=1 Tax=Kaistia soli DSM 19436 TaxID=1122133 RepID=A0A1M5CPM9_9HYPH|nr:acyl-CoA thioesterase II [Kaistia soli]SHF56671.1 acyl-CoA thioesterase-2 [Kaistia soli DSM 19436]